nr:hypothetical protein [Tanacetum cinerariifolium]
MSSASSAVTYTSVYTDSELGRVFWGADEELSDGGSPQVIVYGYDGLPMLPVAPPSPDYIPGPEEPHTPPAPQDEDEHEPMFIQPHDPNFVPEYVYPEYILLKDEHILPAEEKPLPPVVSPTTESPGYVAVSDPEEDPKEDEDDEIEDGPVDYHMDEIDDGDDDDGDSSRDDAADEEEEHLALADFVVVIPIDERVSPPEGTEPIIPPPSTDTDTTGARISVRLQAAISFPPEAEVERLLAMPTPTPSPLTSLSPPSTRERLARCTASAALPSPPLPPPLHMPPPIDHKDDIPETKTPPRKRLCLSTLGSRYEASGTDGRDSLSDGRHETRDGRHAGRVVNTAQIMVPVTRQGPSTLPNNTNPNNMTLESIQAMIDQALLRNSTNRDGSHSSHEDNRRNVQTARPCPNAYSMTWEVLKKKMTDKYYPQGEIKKLEIELWNLKVKENNVSAYTERFQELTLICTMFIADEIEKIDKYKLHTYAERQSNNKRKVDESFRNKHSHQQQTPKRQNVARVYNIGTGERKPYSGNLPKCTKCHFHHNGPCTQKCHKCNKVGHFARDCRSSGNVNVANAQRNNEANPMGNGCFECGATWHFKRDCPKLKNKDGEKVNAPGWVYAVENVKKRGNASRDPDSNVVTSTFLLNNRYASILFDTGADRSFIST